ncbi:ROK family protein [Streptomyces antimycoticus]|uniref:ROK family protein n=2 Tax=Streptomyces antimycoticus TaxID=68175 RepID=UPI001F2EDD1F|nr:ROK family protein [Streptomyces antimycoticus]WJD95117.1 ROK family protein [Streptomyces antimycoticus]
MLDLVVAGEATNRAETARRSGLARSTVGQQVDQLLGRDILQELEGCEPDRVRQVVMGLPAPVDPWRGSPLRPNGMPGWDGFPVAERLRTRFRAPAQVDNDANLISPGCGPWCTSAPCRWPRGS